MILGSLESKLKRTNKIIKTDFAIVLTVANGEIVRFQMLEDSLAVAQGGPRLTGFLEQRKASLFSSAKTKLVSWNELVSLGTEFSI